MNTLPAQSSPRDTARPGGKSSAGFGLGLRTPHYADYLAHKQPLDWLEIITDNFLVEGGKPLVMLDAIRRDYPMAMHGVAMSIGASEGVDPAYLRKVKALADRIEPLWVSDHLCWTGVHPEQLHDLYPLPYTDEAARHVVEQIQRAQDILQRQLVLENVSSYIDFKGNACSEWQFLAHIAQAADCLLLVDVNNIYVSSVNHRFDPLHYLQALPAHRVQQIHLAGHTNNGSYIVDTHDNPVVAEVWELYRAACQLYGPVATMIERDDNIPALQTLITELDTARNIAAEVFGAGEKTSVQQTAAHAASLDSAAHTQAHALQNLPLPTLPPLAEVQRNIADYILDKPLAANAAPVQTLVQHTPDVDPAQRLGIYHHAYRARLAEVLADSFAKTNLYMGSDTFETEATDFAVSHPPTSRSLSRYGANFPAYLAKRYPDNPELSELAQLDWDLRTRFDGADSAALSLAAAQTLSHGSAPQWLAWGKPLHPSLLVRNISTNVTKIWRAIDTDEEAPEVEYFSEAKTMAVWRKELQPHFQTLEPDEARFLRSLLDGNSIDNATNTWTEAGALNDPQKLGAWLQNWLTQGMLRCEMDSELA
jgi:uncharacterized protein (UPF0276 family)